MPIGFSGDGAKVFRAAEFYQVDFRNVIHIVPLKRFKMSFLAPIIYIQPCHGIGVILLGGLQLLLPVHGGDDLAGGLWLGHFGYAGIFLFLMASGGTDRRPHQHNGDEGAKQKSSDLFHSVFSCRVGWRHGSLVVNDIQSFLWRKGNSAEAGVVDRPPRCPLPVVELCQRMDDLAVA